MLRAVENWTEVQFHQVWWHSWLVLSDANRDVRDVLLREVRTLVLTAMVSLILICATVERR